MANQSTKKRVTVWICTDRVGSKMTRDINVDAEDWDSYSESEKTAYVWDEILNHSWIEWGYTE